MALRAGRVRCVDCVGEGTEERGGQGVVVAAATVVAVVMDGVVW